ncbi:MAG: bacteriohopanetetrol glucosamine biosynthesis glycosyltransferase HpnI [Bryobacteraceae bacterium]|nr:bacteriohopanetetrol glucosamine biosynthesis glycosyltransferase HpnI [Bryobacteraceae bacterium]
MIWVLAALAAGSVVFSALVIEAARRYLAVRPSPLKGTPPPVSVLKPVAGLDEGLEENLRSFFEQDYPRFEILFAAHAAADPAVAVVERLRAAYPGVASRLILTGEPPYPNRKVRSLHLMTGEARHDLLVMSDSDIRVEHDFLQKIAAEFQDERLDLTTCPYRAVPGSGIWPRLEAVMMNTEFLGGILVARMMEGMRFAVGPTIVARRKVIEAIGGFESLREYLAEDFVLGQRAAELGMGVGLSRVVMEHRIGTSGFAANVAHRLRWVRSTRRSRPAGYVGQVFTYPVPLALLLVGAWPAAWPVLLVVFPLRAAGAWMTAWCVLRDPLTRSHWWLVPLQDVFSFVFYLAGFFGNTIRWRGVDYVLRRGGRFERK